jgi:hypothetical protein
MEGGKDGWLIWGGAVFLLLLLGWKGVPIIMSYTQRNLRNHNPGNIRISDNPWLGKVPENQNTDGTFEQFQDYQGQPADFWGLRALMINAIAVYQQGGVTLTDFGNIWAPPSDNNGSSDYGPSLANQLGVQPDDSFDVPSNLTALAGAITVNEGGINPYDSSLLNSAAQAALQAKGLA